MSTSREGDAQIEWLRNRAVQVLGRMDEYREVLRLVEAGLGDEEIMAQTGVEHRDVLSVRQDVEQGECLWPETPYEFGLRRLVGEISTEEMMERLRAWPYEFGVVHDDWYDSKSWDDVVRLVMLKAISEDEYDELQQIARQSPDYPHD
ncbi:hypothetical protein EII34_11665 [Arachnia propionica]|uniref:Uncharacterized protein n=1 Tax=Arachnia propionica TaxID=1750 RepID=A0A3P1T4E4_9ACTN|nr:hypothetical protein [Arachnia propionica]RRD04035.1 hypothetical protein EII34_11665 [Arachnia propionica]